MKPAGGFSPIHVVWHDAVSEDAWQELPQAKELRPHDIHTLGYLIEEDDQRIVIALNLDIEREGASQTISIPKTWLLERYKVEIKKKKCKRK